MACRCRTGGTGYTLNGVTGDTAVRVTFAPAPAGAFTVTPSAGANGSVSPGTAQTVGSGGSVFFTAAPAGGFMVDEWLVNGVAVQSGGFSYTLGNVAGDATVRVTFRTQTFTVTSGAGANGSIQPATARTVDAGGSVAFTATAAGGYVVDQWLVNGVPVQAGGGDFTLGTVNGNTSVQVTFKLPDSDGDGMEDGWEMQVFGNLTTAGLGTDADGDGYADTEEFLRGLDPQAVTRTDYQPDGQIGFGAGFMQGNGRYDRYAITQLASTRVARGKSKTCLVFVQNDGQLTDTIRVQATAIGGNFTVRYYDGIVDVTAKALAGTLKFRNLAPGRKHVLKVVIRARGSAIIGEMGTVAVSLTSARDANAQDAVRCEATAR